MATADRVRGASLANHLSGRGNTRHSGRVAWRRRRAGGGRQDGSRNMGADIVVKP